MLKRIVCITLSFILVTSFFISSFTVQADDIDFIETYTVPAPTVPTDGKLLAEDELITEFNDEYYNEDHLFEDETEAGEFDTKAELHTVTTPELPNSSKSTNDQLGSELPNSATSTKESQTQIFSMREDSPLQSDEYDIMPIADSDYEIPFSDISDLSNWYDRLYFTFHTNRNWTVNDVPYILNALKNNVKFTNWSDVYNECVSRIPDIFDLKNLVIIGFWNEGYQHSKEDVYYPSGYVYFYYFTDHDLYLENVQSVYNCIIRDKNIVVINPSCGYEYQDRSQYYYSFNCAYVYFDDYTFWSGATGYSSSDVIVTYSGGHNVYLDGVKQDVEITGPDGFIQGDINGDFNLIEGSKILTYRAWSDEELDKTYDVHLWALDNPTVPAKINEDIDFLIRDLDNYSSHELQLSPDKSSVQGSYDLESVYYYLHQMRGYDDSLESVDGYDFTEFESRENLNFAIAYREKGTSGDWIVCKSYQYNYGDIIENVMGSFTVKKDYVDFPDMSDYIEDFESWDDVAADCADEDGEYNVIEVGLKWIGRNLMHFAHNFVGFFEWLWDCIPVLWENLTIALYNLVCDLKELALYFVNPKTKSIYTMVNERIPGFATLVNSFNSSSAAQLPSFTLFGTKFSLDFNDYNIDFSFLRSITTILFYILFGFSVFKLIFKIFGFGSGSGGGDDE